jgi:hypothetical protein
MCATYIKNVLGAQSQCPPISEYPIAQSVCFNYYLGRLKVFEEKYAEAEVALDFAFKRYGAWSTSTSVTILNLHLVYKLARSFFFTRFRPASPVAPPEVTRRRAATSGASSNS